MKRELRPAMKLTVYVADSERHAHKPLYREVVRALHEAGISGATLTKGVMSFGVQRRLHTIKDEVRMDNLPVIIEAVDIREKIEHAGIVVSGMLGEHGLVEIQPTMVACEVPVGWERSEN